jgi:integrase
MWNGMGAYVMKLTRKYVAGSPGFGAHAFRHIVATHWLEQNPNDFLTVAELLNDRLETVMKTYAHLRKDTSFLRYEEYLQKVMKDGTVS